MRLSHFSKELCNKPVLYQNVMKELTLASALFWASIISHISYSTFLSPLLSLGLDLVKILLLQSPSYSPLAV